MHAWPEHVWGKSHTGHKRQTNEDRFLIRRLEEDRGIMLAVADGMGGEAGGEIAAKMAIDTLDRSTGTFSASEHDLARALTQAGEDIKHQAQSKSGLQNMGTTATVVVVSHKTAHWSHVGDSRLYLWRANRLEQITSDHTFVQDLVADGTLSQEEAEHHPLRNMLDQCVGCGNLQADSGRFDLTDGDKLLLCSDGLTKHVSNESIQTALAQGNARQAVESLVKQALDAGGKDNVTVVVMDFKIQEKGT